MSDEDNIYSANKKLPSKLNKLVKVSEALFAKFL